MIPIESNKFNRLTPLEPEGVNSIIEDLKRLSSVIETHLEGERYLHKTQLLSHGNKRVHSIVNESRGSLGGVSSKLHSYQNFLDETSKELLVDQEEANKRTSIKINNKTGQITLAAKLGSNIQVGNAIDTKEITIVSTKMRG